MSLPPETLLVALPYVLMLFAMLVAYYIKCERDDKQKDKSNEIHNSSMKKYADNKLNPDQYKKRKDDRKKKLALRRKGKA